MFSFMKGSCQFFSFIFWKEEVAYSILFWLTVKIWM